MFHLPWSVLLHLQNRFTRHYNLKVLCFNKEVRRIVQLNYRQMIMDHTLPDYVWILTSALGVSEWTLSPEQLVLLPCLPLSLLNVSHSKGEADSSLGKWSWC